MLRGTVDGLVCDRAGETAEFSCRFDGVEVDGRFFRETVSFRQRWHLGRIIEEEQWRGAAAFAHTSTYAHPARMCLLRRAPPPDRAALARIEAQERADGAGFGLRGAGCG